VGAIQGIINDSSVENYAQDIVRAMAKGLIPNVKIIY